MTSLMILLIAVAVVAAAVSFLTRATITKMLVLYTVCVMVGLSVDNWIVTPLYNIINVDFAISSNSNFHSMHRETILSYVKSDKWNEFPHSRKIEEDTINQVLADLRGATKATSEEAYTRLECYLNEVFNRYNLHGRAAVRCFGRTLNGSKQDNGMIRMWTSLLVYGASNLQTEQFQVFVKPSIVEAAIADVESTFARWEEEDKLLDAFNAKQDKRREDCMSIWNRPMTSTSQRFSLQWLHEHCSSKYPVAWTIGDIKH